MSPSSVVVTIRQLCISNGLPFDFTVPRTTNWSTKPPSIGANRRRLGGQAVDELPEHADGGHVLAGVDLLAVVVVPHDRAGREHADERVGIAAVERGAERVDHLFVGGHRSLLSVDVETLGARRHLVEELATSRRVRSTRHVAEVLQDDQAVDAEVLVARTVSRSIGPGTGVMVISSGPSSAGRSTSSARRSSSAMPARVLSRSWKKPYQPSHRATARRRAGGRHPAGQDRRPTGAVRLRPALDAAERREVAPELGLVVTPQGAERVDPLVGPVGRGSRTAPRSPRTRPARTRRRCRPSADRATARRRWRAPWPGSPGCATAGSRCRCRAGCASVTAAAYASTGTGSISSECDGSGDGGTCGSISTGCSPTQIDSKPRASAVCADGDDTFGVGERAGADAEPPDRDHRLRGAQAAVAARLGAADVGPDVDDEREDHDEPPEAGDALDRRVRDRPRQRRPRQEDEAEQAPTRTSRTRCSSGRRTTR